MAYPTIQIRDAANNIVTVNTIPNPGQAISADSMSVVLASDHGQVPFVPATLANTMTSNTAVDIRSYSRVTIQVVSLSGGDSLAFTKSIDSTNYVNDSLVSSNGTYFSSVTSNGIYYTDGNSYLKYQKTGSSSTPVITILASN